MPRITRSVRQPCTVGDRSAAAGQCRESFGEGVGAARSHMLVAHRLSRGGVAEAVHHLAGGGPGAVAPYRGRTPVRRVLTLSYDSRLRANTHWTWMHTGASLSCPNEHKKDTAIVSSTPRFTLAVWGSGVRVPLAPPGKMTFFAAAEPRCDDSADDNYGGGSVCSGSAIRYCLSAKNQRR